MYLKSEDITFNNKLEMAQAFKVRTIQVKNMEVKSMANVSWKEPVTEVM